MDPHLTRLRTNNPEAVVQKAGIAFMEARGWFVMPTHGNAVQRGFPDTYCVHKLYGQRWVEYKYMESYSFTEAQIECFPKINEAKVGIWIITAANHAEYSKLFDPKYMPLGNWMDYFRAYALLGSKVFKDRVAAKKTKCVCGLTYLLRPSEKVLCTCKRIVTGA